MIHSLNFTLDALDYYKKYSPEKPNVSVIIWNMLSSNSKKVVDLRNRMNYPLAYSSLICRDLRGSSEMWEEDEFNVWRDQ